MLTELLNSVSAPSEGIGIILPIGLAVFFGTVGARIFQKLHIPQIIGYISVGIILGPVLNVVSAGAVQALEPFNLFALGIIGFLIGGELKREVFVKFGRQVAAILLFEGGIAFLLVTLLSFLVLSHFHHWQIALGAGVVLGAICAATDPASTVNVLWEYKTRGPLTTMLTAVVALDDALALVLYIIGVSVAGFLTGHREGSPLQMALYALNEIVGSLALGVAAALVLRWIIARIRDDEKTLVFTVGTIVLTIGLAKHLHMDVILSAMALGVALMNLAPRRSLKSFELVRRFSPLVYVLFFVIIGARFNISSLSPQIWLLVAAYVIGSIVGKTTGSSWGAAYSKAAPTVRKYLGFCLYQQGTIAVALLIMASHRFEGEIRDIMLSVIIMGVFVLQLVGPLFVKMGVKKGQEVGLNITEEDLIQTYKVADVMDARTPTIAAGMSLRELVEVVSSTDCFYYPVVDNDKKLIGAVTLDGIRNTFTTQELNDWLVALDVMEPVIDRITPDAPLAEALDRAKRLDIEHLPVVASSQQDTFAGLLNCRAVRRALSAEVLARQQKADNIHNT
ncbi:MAG: cation:proton antiporter domain-containing protein [Planctomycetota bacterium]|jgi:Kef-type K+ transport system membrane component KefB